ncbi:ABC transporter ATP-binding protein [Francisella philomiragia]|uniref:ABC transporter ATP-binding protein n=1 Tax=Francisella philomiragia TaxID=28110 RepID=UPI0005A561DF|nr:ABC transporter ATP-binding protein [Francisella philomiragia]AJI56124.1 ABC transporter family protein [Francisella philomiragia]MBK2253646.1 ABC transporter ATP-binding protein [Francisella philomiragia]
MKKGIAIKLDNVSKYYKIYDRARDRVKEAFSPFRKKYYKEFCAVKDINLEIKKGEVLGIFGLNGAGKSTLLKMIAGVVTPSKGRVITHGHINAMLELTGSLNPELTGRQNIDFNLSLNGVADSEKPQVTKSIIDFAEIGDHLDQPVKSYSSGMGARLGFGIATSTKPEILIVDEVLAVGDVVFQNKCFIKIRELLKGGTTVVFVSHNISLMIEFCNRAILLYDREILFDGPSREIAHYYQKILFSNDRNRTIAELKGLPIELAYKSDESSILSNINNENVIVDQFSIYDTEGVETSFLETGCVYDVIIQIKFKKNYEKVRLKLNASDITGKQLNFLDSVAESLISNVYEHDSYVFKTSFKNIVFIGKYSIKLEILDITDKRYSVNLLDHELEIRFESGVIGMEPLVNIDKIEADINNVENKK